MNKKEARKAKGEGGGEKAKRKSQDCSVTLIISKHYPEILLSVHAWTLHANILHLDQKAAKCATCDQLCTSFSF